LIGPKKRPVHAHTINDEPPESSAELESAIVAAPEPEAQPSADTTLLPVLADEVPPLATRSGPPPKLEPGLYAVLGLDPSVPDAQIQTTYRRMAAKLIGDGENGKALKQLNAAYEVLGNPLRRTEYDRLRLTQSLSPGPPTPIRPGAKAKTKITRRRRPRHTVQPRYPGLGDVMVVVTVVGLAVLAGVLLVPRLTINLSALNALQVVLPLSSSSARRVIDTTSTAVPDTPVPTATPPPSLAAQFFGSTVGVSNPTPPQNSIENITVQLKRNGKPAPALDVWSSVQYRTTEERWPTTGTVTTDHNGAATITFNIGAATPNYPVNVHVFARVDDQQLAWTTSFTPR
jgi:hypothetical protein